MRAHRASGGAVRLVAWMMSLVYPPSFRRAHRQDFSDVADHLFEREAQQRTPVAAALEISRVLIQDTVSATPGAWCSALAPDSGQERMSTILARRMASFIRGGRHDLSLAVRAVRRRPGFSAMVVGTLGLGIGASSAAFDALDRAILRPMPYANSHELVLLVMQETTQQYMTSVPLQVVQEWRARSATLKQVEIFRRMSAIRVTDAGADQLEAIGISGGLPALLGLRPVVGRVITPADAAATAPAVVMLGEAFWRREYGGDPAVVGRQITIAGKPTEIVGVWPSGARLDYFKPPEVIRVLPGGNEYARGSWVQILARMEQGVSADAAQNELRAITTTLPPSSTLKYQAKTVAPADLLLGEQFVTGLWLVFAGAIVLLAAASANAAHLLLERATERNHELGVRLALGSSRARIARLFLCEAAVYSVAALALGAALGLGLERIVSETEPRLFRDSAGAGLAGRAFYFAAAAAIFTAIACALAPLLRTQRADVSTTLGPGGGRVTVERSRARFVLVAAQSALAVLLVFGATLMIRSLTRLNSVDPGIAVAHLAEVSVSLPAAKYPSPESRQIYIQRATDAVANIPGVIGAVPSGMPILLGSLMSGIPHLDGEPEVNAPPDANTVVTNIPLNYLTVMGMQILEGRMFAPGEKRVALVSDAFSRSRHGGIVGRQLYLPRSKEPYTIVGVVNNVRYSQLANDLSGEQPAVYLPSAPSSDSYLRLIIRTTGDPAAVIAATRQRFAEIDPTVPVLSPQTGMEVIRGQTAQHRFVARLLTGLACLGFLLAMSGVYGAVALNVVRRTREVGVRMALGAQASRLISAFIVSGLRPVIFGAVAGSIGVWLCAPYVKALLFRVPAHDPLSVTIGLGVVIATSTLAALLPARRIVRVDPAHTLRDA